ncbi:hypothetical protein HPP92_017726 [Vanilla planifolia]|uniref:Probable glutathione S-transferase GSTU1 n=1 Tax=Vanilla planifolia TaxID=51239 RepID=A0A835Q4I8_VANPL|nr:hypothetical protein HPP92_017726 [Vanilla planifolia]
MTALSFPFHQTHRNRQNLLEKTDRRTMGGQKGLKLVDFWASPFGQRVRIALAEKGVEYDYHEENLPAKSELLLKCNPVHKKIPVLIHDGRPVCESLFIIQYIDEVWPDENPIIPSDPYSRAQTRFWADYVEKKVYLTGGKLWKLKGEELEEGKKEFVEIVKTLEEELGNKKYFGGESFGLVDIALVPFTSWFYVYEVFGWIKVERVAPKLVAWANRCKERGSVAKTLPDPEKVFEHVVSLRKRFGVD